MPTRDEDEPQIDDAHPVIIPALAAGSPAQGPTVEQPAKLIRIASMIRELLEDVRQSKPDEPGRKRLRDVYERAVAALKEGVSKELQEELDTLTLPLVGTPSESEIRLAQAQLVGWLEGLFQGIQAALWTSTCRRAPRSTKCGGAVACHRAPATDRHAIPVSTCRGRSLVTFFRSSLDLLAAFTR